jgi:phosphohistidine phosphatase
MRIFLIRHAEASPLGSGWVRDDADRPLSARGRGDARRTAAALRDRGVAFDRILASPRMRAVQTAEIHAAALGYAGLVESIPFLGRSGAWQDGLERLLEQLAAEGAGSVALVGHNPDVSDVAARLARADEGKVALPAGAVCCFEIAAPRLDGDARLAFWLDPRDLSFHESL